MGDTIPHVVRPGEHLYEIAVRYWTDVATIWGLPQNQTLKDQGRTPEQVAEGDIVYVPVVTKRFLKPSVGQTNSFNAPVPTTEVKVKLQGDDGKALANVAFEVRQLGVTGQSDGDGTIHLKKVPHAIKTLHVHLVERDVTLHVRTGDLDPVSTPNGKAQRLAHLGYLPARGAASPDAVGAAFQAFCKDKSVEDASKADQEAALAKAHGS